MVNKRLLKMMGKSKRYIWMTVFVNWLSLLASIVFIYVVGTILNDMFNNKVETMRLVYAFLIVVGCILIKYVTSIYASKMTFLSSKDVKTVLRETIYNKLNTLGVNYHQKIHTSSIIQVAIEGVEQLETYFGAFLPQLFYSVLAPVTLFLLLTTISFKAAIVLLICVPLIPLSIVAVMKIAKKLLSRYWNRYTKLGDHFLENIQGLTTLKIYQQDEAKAKQMDAEAQNFRKVTMKVLTMQLNSIAVMDIIAYGGAAIGTIIAIFEFQKGAIDFLGFFIIVMLSSEFFIPLRLLGSFFHVAMNSVAASNKIFELLDLPESSQDGVSLSETITQIDARDVSFAYETQRGILKNITFSASKDKLIAFVGESGSGKSSIAKVLMGINKGYQGSVVVNTHELSSISDASIMQKMTLIGNNNYVFKGSVRENLTMGKSISDQRLYDVLKQVKLYDFLMNLDGLDTKLLQQGNNLSGGQKQRLTIAKALLKDSDVYIFDEATSNIDVESEVTIMEVIYNLAKSKMVIMISHRLANVEGANCIYVLKDGYLVESGNHQELMHKQGQYFMLHSQQSQLEQYSRKDVQYE